MFFFFSSRRRHTRFDCDWSSDVCSSDLSPSADRPYGHARVPNGDQTMKLARLELSGFKSFAVPVELAFDEGVTAVVGPNGCGKSNISDAVRWVLGEQRTRLLRGLRMEDVIFHGSVKRKPGRLA